MPNQNQTLVFGDVVYNFNSIVGHRFARYFWGYAGYCQNSRKILYSFTPVTIENRGEGGGVGCPGEW